jgi:acyl-CoA thioesterase II
VDDLHSELALDGGSGRYRRTMSDDWTFADRVFGGYTAGLAVAAAHRESPHPRPVAAHVMFLEAARPGSLELEVTSLRTGRCTWAGRTVARQAGSTILACDTWFAAKAAEVEATADRDGTAPPPRPDQCVSMDWLRDSYPFVAFLEERAIDYPSSVADFRNGSSRVDVWARPVRSVAHVDPVTNRIVELMLADAHLLDAALRPIGLETSLAVSLDLTMWWDGPTPIDGWYRMTAEAGAHGDFVACTGRISTQSGAVVARTGQQGRLLPVPFPVLAAPPRARA